VQLLITEKKKPDREKVFAHNAFPRIGIVSLLAAMTWAGGPGHCFAHSSSSGIQPLHLRRHKPAQGLGPGTGIFLQQERDGPQQSDRRPPVRAVSSKTAIGLPPLPFCRRATISWSRRTNDADRFRAPYRHRGFQDLFHPILHRNRAPRRYSHPLCQPSTRTTWTGHDIQGRLYDYRTAMLRVVTALKCSARS